jgi:hypothetical protein
MHVQYAKRLAVFIAATAPLLGPQTLSAECVSARFSDQVYHSCSGVLTVMPAQDGQHAGPSRKSGAPLADNEREIRDGDEEKAEESHVTGNP